MKEGDRDANYAYYCLHKFRMLPSQFAALERREKAFIIAAIDLKIEADKKEQAKMRKK